LRQFNMYQYDMSVYLFEMSGFVNISAWSVRNKWTSWALLSFCSARIVADINEASMIAPAYTGTTRESGYSEIAV